MHSTIESVLAAQNTQERIQQADRVRQARAVQRQQRTAKHGHRWFRRADAAVTPRAVHSGP
jgi:hypothetical protein